MNSHPVQRIKEPIATEMTTLMHRVEACIRTDNPLLQAIIKHNFQSPGKQMRPMSVFLVAGAYGEVTEMAYRGATLVTLLHQASLVHDDIVDNASCRRNLPTINTTWSNKVAVLSGDYLLAKGLSLAVAHRDDHFMAFMTEAAQAMTEGELIQLVHARQVDLPEDTYLDIIHKKTAQLWGVCFAIGATAASKPTTQVAAMRQAGEHVGMAFQIRDDVLDYSSEDIGKESGMDLNTGQLTLPIIYALKHASCSVRTQVSHIIQTTEQSPLQKQTVRDFVQESGGITYAQRIAQAHCQSALDILQDLPSTPYKEALLTLVHYTVDRDS